MLGQYKLVTVNNYFQRSTAQDNSQQTLQCNIRTHSCQHAIQNVYK